MVCASILPLATLAEGHPAPTCRTPGVRHALPTSFGSAPLCLSPSLPLISGLDMGSARGQLLYPKTRAQPTLSHLGAGEVWEVRKGTGMSGGTCPEPHTRPLASTPLCTQGGGHREVSLLLKTLQLASD